MAYESKKFRIRQQGDLVALTFPGVGYNYVKFQFVAKEKAFKLDDGHSMFAAVTALDGELIARKIRMIFADGTPPDAVAKTLNKGDCRIVLGMPRVSLALVSWRLANKEDDRDPLNWQMPYEIVVTGVLPGTCAAPDYDVND